MQVSNYLQGRRYNSQLLTKLGEEVFDPLIEKFNDDNDRGLEVEWCMSSKYQSIIMSFRMEDKEDLTSEAIEEICYGPIADAMSEWFAAEADDDDAANTYFSVDIGL